MTRKTYRIAVTPGDGIGRGAMSEGLRVFEAVARRLGISFETQYIDWASCDHYQQRGQMMPDDWKQQLQGMDAVLSGVVGWSATVPDHASLWGSLFKFCHELDQYVNLCPVRLFEGVPYPPANCKPGDINYYVVRENTEGEYASLGGTMYKDTDREIVIQESVYLRKGAERLLKFTLDFAQSCQRKHVTLAIKSSGIVISMSWRDKRADEVAQSYPDVTPGKQHIDILTVCFVLQPGRLDMVAATNLLGDILSDLGSVTTGTAGLVPSANLNPDRTFPSLFEPVHGSAPDIYGKNIANPIAMVRSGASMLDFLVQGQDAGRAAHDAIAATIKTVLKEGPRIPDLGGVANIIQVGEAIVAHLG